MYFALDVLINRLKCMEKMFSTHMDVQYVRNSVAVVIKIAIVKRSIIVIRNVKYTKPNLIPIIYVVKIEILNVAD